MAAFEHANYTIVNDIIVRKQEAPPKSDAEQEEVLFELARYIEARIMTEFGFEPIFIPELSDFEAIGAPQTSILASRNWKSCTKMLMIIQNQSHSCIGIFSRSTLMRDGVSKGTVLPYLQRALDMGYGVLLLRPNTNSVIDESDGSKHPIVGSESPEIHALYVLENIVTQAENVAHIALFGYGNGASLCKDILLRQIARSQSEGRREANRIKAFVTIEASQIVESDDAGDVKASIADMAVNMELNVAPRGYKLAYRAQKLGCTSISLGLPPGQRDVDNVADSISLALDPVFTYLQMAEAGGKAGKNFAIAMARENGHDPRVAEVTINPGGNELSRTAPRRSQVVRDDEAAGGGGGWFTRMFRSSSSPAVAVSRAKSRSLEDDSGICVEDFDLLKVVGKGAFGKVNHA